MPTPLDPRLGTPQCNDLCPVTVEHKNPWFTVYNRGGRYTVEYNQAQVLVLPVVDGRFVVFVKVKRPVLADDPLELPAGSLEPGETAPQAARRELSEETGIDVQDLSRFVPLPPISASPNRNPLLFHVMRVDLTMREFDQRMPHDSEVSQVVLMNAKEAQAAVQIGDVYVVSALAIVACHFLLERQS